MCSSISLSRFSFRFPSFHVAQRPVGGLFILKAAITSGKSAVPVSRKAVMGGEWEALRMPHSHLEPHLLKEGDKETSTIVSFFFALSVSATCAKRRVEQLCAVTLWHRPPCITMFTDDDSRTTTYGVLAISLPTTQSVSLFCSCPFSLFPLLVSLPLFHSLAVTESVDHIFFLTPPVDYVCRRSRSGALESCSSTHDDLNGECVGAHVT